ncbi:hypothetical protein FI667_g11368, partial [Globisporangium splendens]
MKHAAPANGGGADLARAADNGRTRAHEASYGDPAESMGGSASGTTNAYGAEKSLTPMTMDHDWDGYAHRKHAYGLQPTLGVLRNDRTPLNTPYTPQLVKLQLERHEEYREQQQQEEQEYKPAKQLVSSIKSKECGQSRDGSGAPKCDTRVTIVYTKSYMDFVVLYDGVEHPVCAAAESDAHRVQHLHVADLDGGARRAGGARAGARVEPPATHGANGDSTSHPNSIYRHANLTTRHGEQDEE